MWTLIECYDEHGQRMWVELQAQDEQGNIHRAKLPNNFPLPPRVSASEMITVPPPEVSPQEADDERTK